MIVKTMRLTARRELLSCIRQRYQDADWSNKGRVLDGFIATNVILTRAPFANNVLQ